MKDKLDMVVVVLAAGESSRYGEPGEYKQLLEVYGEQLWQRLERLWKSNEPRSSPWYIVNKENNPWVMYGECQQERPSKILFERPRMVATTAGTLFSVLERFDNAIVDVLQDGLIILFSDVFYPDQAPAWFEARARDAVASGETCWFTDGQDIFGLVVPAADVPNVMAAAKKVAEEKPNMGRLWEVYRLLHGITEFPLKPEAKACAFFGPPMQDFDTKEDYQRFLAGETKNVLKPIL